MYHYRGLNTLKSIFQEFQIRSRVSWTMHWKENFPISNYSIFKNDYMQRNFSRK